MNEVYKIINEYYYSFESYKGVLSLRSIWTWLAVIGTVLFLFTFSMSIFKDAFKETFITNFKYWFPLCLVTELCTIGFYVKLEKLRDDLAIKKCQKLLSTDENNILELKKLWFHYSIKEGREQYLSIAEKVDKLNLIREKSLVGFLPKWKDIGNSIYTYDTKSRLLVIFMGTVAAIIALCISAGANIFSVISLFEDVGAAYFFAVTSGWAIIIWLSGLAIKYSFLFLSSMVELLVSYADGKNSLSTRRAKIFINELLKLYKLPKPRIRCYHDGTIKKIE